MKAIRTWFNNRSLATQLYLGFSVVFLSAMLILVHFIRTTPQLADFNAWSRDATGQLRQYLNVRTLVGDLELAINRFEISGDEFHLVEYTSVYNTLESRLEKLQTSADSEDTPALQQMASTLPQIDRIFQQLVDASYRYDEQAVITLDENLYDLIPQLDDAIQSLIDGQREEQTAFEDSLYMYDISIYVGLLISLPIILLAGLFAAFIITLRINGPLVALASAARSLKSGRPDLKPIEKLAARGGQMGELAADFLEMSRSSARRQAELQAEAENIRGKIK